MNRLANVFSFSGRISRLQYVAIACIGVLIKHAIDLMVAASFGRYWDLTRYLVPLGVPIAPRALTRDEIHFLVAMLAVSVPFAWVGLAITTRRFRTIGWPLWLVVLFFVPIANIASFAVAAAWPEHETSANTPSDSWLVRMVPKDPLGAAVLALLVAGALGAALVPVGTVLLGSYGWGLFAAIPFVQGAIAAYAYAVHGQRSLRGSILIALLSVGVTATALVALALEGVLCIAMAAPIAGAFASVGAAFAYSIGRQRPTHSAAAIAVCVLLAPSIMGAEKMASPVAPTYAVTTSVDIAAPPRVVWRNVIRFPDLPTPTEFPFRAGIAYPVRAKIVGSGVGAVRYCEFSTGDFVEPITVWQPGRRLAFSVRRSAEPMNEWSPYGHIDTSHLHNYMISRQGEFVLEPLPGGGTRLVGTTWYQHHLWPAAYWRLWSDAIVHEIHYRVLHQIKALSERKFERRASGVTHRTKVRSNTWGDTDDQSEIRVFAAHARNRV